ncbi:hypothetical protein QBC45DRAFT_446782 [Copromyces sp. CBS 386.78]|nr:hypothetical protein QBC45DRAFT_446782 [Copromyces sp. CBS 386.78]
MYRMLAIEAKKELPETHGSETRGFGSSGDDSLAVVGPGMKAVVVVFGVGVVGMFPSTNAARVETAMRAAVAMVTGDI